jgi:hypothetical protein
VNVVLAIVNALAVRACVICDVAAFFIGLFVFKIIILVKCLFTHYTSYYSCEQAKMARDKASQTTQRPTLEDLAIPNVKKVRLRASCVSCVFLFGVSSYGDASICVCVFLH